MSTVTERLAEVYAAYLTANSNKVADLKAATTDAQVTAILANVQSLHAAYLDAATAALAANGQAIEDAYQAAKDANTAVTNARQSAQALPQKLTQVVNLTTHAADTIKTLVTLSGA